MSSIASPVKGIDQIRFFAFPTKPMPGLRVVRVDRTLVGVAENGLVYSTEISNGCHYIGGGGRSFDNTFKGLKKLKVLTKEQVKQHEDWHCLRAAKRERKWAAGAMRDHLKTLGIRPTNAQVRALDRAIEEGEEL